MSVGNVSPPPNDLDPMEEASTDRWAIRLFQLSGFRVSLSYNVPIGLIILVMVVGGMMSRPGNHADLPAAAAIGFLFWVSGWLAQSLSWLGIGWLCGTPTRSLRIGILGVEAYARRRPAIAALAVAVGSMTTLLLLACFYRLVEGGFRMPQLARADSDIFAVPGIGFSSYDSIWRSAAWLCAAQCILQMYPLPGTPGRQIVAGFAALSGRRLRREARTKLFRLCIDALALVTLLIAVVSFQNPQWGFNDRWPILFAGAVLLWMSSRAPDVARWMKQLEEETPARDQPELDKFGRANADGLSGFPAWYRRFSEKLSDRKRLRKAKQALSRERNEATDARRLDEVLNRLHTEGPDSLTSDDRRILRRVSEALRRERETKEER